MSDVIIKPQNNGPYHVKGKFNIVTEGGREIAFEGDETWLCRCGQSANKPFCDGSHKKAGLRQLRREGVTGTVDETEGLCHMERCQNKSSRLPREEVTNLANRRGRELGRAPAEETLRR